MRCYAAGICVITMVHLLARPLESERIVPLWLYFVASRTDTWRLKNRAASPFLFPACE